jgi:hypothetical protein
MFPTSEKLAHLKNLFLRNMGLLPRSVESGEV